jgi:nucleoside-diphosphate-sugar epimerase
MNYFVTGATGFIGGVLARQLREAGHEVIALVRNPAKARELAALGVRLAQGDITDKDSMRDPMTGVDGVFHIAGWYKLGALGKEKEQGYAINVEGTRNTLELMRELNIAKGVYTSTVAINSDTKGKLVDESYRYNGPHLTEYDRTKWLAHWQVAEPMVKAGLPLVTVMPGVVYGPDDPSNIGGTFRDYLQRRFPLIPTATYCWAHVEDVAQAHILAMEKGNTGESYIIAGPVHTIAEALDTAQTITGIPASRIRLPGAMIKATAALSGVMEKVFTLPETYRSEVLRSSGGVSYIGDNRKARQQLGYNPRSLREGLMTTLAYEMAKLGLKA